MKNWSVEEEKGISVCPSKDDCLDAERVAKKLNIPFEIVYVVYLIYHIGEF